MSYKFTNKINELKGEVKNKRAIVIAFTKNYYLLSRLLNIRMIPFKKIESSNQIPINKSGFYVIDGYTEKLKSYDKVIVLTDKELLDLFLDDVYFGLTTSTVKKFINLNPDLTHYKDEFISEGQATLVRVMRNDEFWNRHYDRIRNVKLQRIEEKEKTIKELKEESNLDKIEKLKINLEKLEKEDIHGLNNLFAYFKTSIRNHIRDYRNNIQRIQIDLVEESELDKYESNNYDILDDTEKLINNLSNDEKLILELRLGYICHNLCPRKEIHFQRIREHSELKNLHSFMDIGKIVYSNEPNLTDNGKESRAKRKVAEILSKIVKI